MRTEPKDVFVCVCGGGGVINSLGGVARGSRWRLSGSSIGLFSIFPSSHLTMVRLHPPLVLFPKPTCNQPSHACHRGNESLCLCEAPVSPTRALTTASILLSTQPSHSCCWELVCFCSNEDFWRRGHFTLDSPQHPWYVSAFRDEAQACAVCCLAALLLWETESPKWFMCINCLQAWKNLQVVCWFHIHNIL